MSADEWLATVAIGISRSEKTVMLLGSREKLWEDSVPDMIISS